MDSMQIKMSYTRSSYGYLYDDEMVELKWKNHCYKYNQHKLCGELKSHLYNLEN